ncbi:hypothetical protein [Dokdonia sp.]|uniref:hypothetical protein n=1 Tax=Dokdonia sp. TaxID=2024995 RepID=UPI003264E886
MENKSAKKSKLIGLRKSTVAKLIASGNQIKGGAAQQFVLLEDAVEKREFTTELIDG